MIYNTLFLLTIRKDVAKFVVCCSRDWLFKGQISMTTTPILTMVSQAKMENSDDNVQLASKMLQITTMRKI